MEFENKSILTNMGDPSIGIILGVASGAIFLAIKAVAEVLSQTPDSPEKFEGGKNDQVIITEPDEMETETGWSKRAILIRDFDESQSMKTTIVAKIKCYILEASKEYKYNFFL